MNWSEATIAVQPLTEPRTIAVDEAPKSRCLISTTSAVMNERAAGRYIVTKDIEDPDEFCQPFVVASQT